MARLARFDPAGTLLALALVPIAACPAAGHARSQHAREIGIASFYGREWRGHRTASGERFDPDALTAAHRTLPFGTRVRLTNLDNGRHATVRINDRGPFV